MTLVHHISNKTSESENELVEACLKSDKKAQKALYERYVGKMNAVCRRYVFAQDERKDILQEGFIKVFQNLDKYRSEGPLEAWIRRIMVNTTLSYLRKTKHNNNDTKVDITDYQDSLPSEEQEEDTFWENDFSKEAVLKAIDSLPEKYKVVFNLYCIEDYSHKTIAELLVISEEGSRTRLRRAKEMLKLQLVQLYQTQKKING